MIGLGTLINCAMVLLGGAVGLLFGRAIRQEVQRVMTIACGLSSAFIGASGTLARMLALENGSLTSGGAMLLVISLVLGGLTGALLDIEGKLERLGLWLRRKSHSEGDSRFMDGFTSAAFTICIGAMAIIGPMNDALYHDYSLLVTKGILDCIIVMALSASLGRGAVFSVVPLFLFQGAMTLLACLVGPLLSDAALANLSCVGNSLIFCVGVNLMFDTKLPVANLLPSLIVACVMALF
ncbi:MAG: DUF554 domain-containing protein [Clostridia bacterium]|nr:DUF554 domain-containing protein [Clostridia bacterium]